MDYQVMHTTQNSRVVLQEAKLLTNSKVIFQKFSHLFKQFSFLETEPHRALTEDKYSRYSRGEGLGTHEGEKNKQINGGKKKNICFYRN